jgi:tetratricopeptide (TPR) repeat protein
LRSFLAEFYCGQYNLIMSRWLRAAHGCLLMAGLALPAQQKPSEQKPPEQQEQAPPEEDEAEKPKEYSFNPLQADKEVRIGNYYFHKGNYRAAAQRFREATKWNNNFAEAYLRLGEAEEKQKDLKAAREAYAKFLELAADDKRSAEVRKKVERLSKRKG